MAAKDNTKRKITANINPDLFEIGSGRVLGARKKSGGHVEVGVVYLDVFCRGATDAAYHVIPEHEFETRLREEADDMGEFREIDPACARKIIMGAVEFARGFGFAPHRDLKKAMRMFGGVKATDCPEQFTFGQNGKPYLFHAGEPDKDLARTFVHLYRRCGWDGFDFMISSEAAEMIAERFDELGLPLPDMDADYDDCDTDLGKHEPGPGSPAGNHIEHGMTPFVHEFPDIGYRETRVLSLNSPEGDLPPGEYGLFESYCVDPTCDCRRVLLHVRASSDPETVLATINFGWESESFYTEWVGGNPEAARDMAGATLDPFNPQSEHASTFLDLFENVVLQDDAYIESLKKHYLMFRSRVRKRKFGRSTTRKDPTRALHGTERLSLPSAEEDPSHDQRSR